MESIVENILVTSCMTLTFPSSLSAVSFSSSAAISDAFPTIMEVISNPVLWICKGYSDRVSSSTFWMYSLTPLDRERISAIPMIPMEPAKAVRSVLAFLVFRLLKLSASAVRNDIDDFPIFLCFGGSACVSSTSYGSVSERIFPSRRVTILVAYCSASSGLCVTITTRRSFATSWSRSMTCTLVSLSNAPVGSSASKMSGSLTNALAIATLCIWPPDIWLGLLWSCFPSPTFSSASVARLLRSLFPIPEIVSASSTFASTLWCGIRL